MHVAFKSELEKSILAVTRWVEKRDYAAYDPGDGSMSFLRAFAFNSLFLERLLTAFVLRVPFNIRPWIGIKPHVSTKGMGYMAWGYLWMHENTGEEAYRQRAVACLEWLAQHRSARSKHFCWGNHFTFVTRNGRIPAHEPTIVWSSLIGQAFLKAYDLLQDARYLEIAASIADWILTLPREKTDRGDCLSYVGSFQSSIHNSNMLGAALLAGVARHTGHQEAKRVAREAMTYSCARQLPDGAWYYGEAEKNHWVDSFHTGYNLDSLRRYIDATGDDAFAGELQRGYGYFKNNFFLGDGAPKYFHNRARPIDIQCASQCIDTLAFFSDRDPSALDLARRVAHWTISTMQDADGHFYYRDLGWMKIKTPMLHWGQGTMFKALAHLLAASERNNVPSKEPRLPQSVECR